MCRFHPQSINFCLPMTIGYTVLRKKVWKEQLTDFQDDVYSSLMLLHQIDIDTERYVKHWFERNMTQLTKEGALELVGTRTVRKAAQASKRIKNYETFLKNQRRQTL